MDSKIFYIGAHYLKRVLLIAFLCLLCIHFLIKDRWFSLSIIYYACPLPLLIAFGIVLTSLFFGNKRLFYALALLQTGLIIYFGTHYFGTAATPKSDLEIKTAVFWNMAQNKPIPTSILIETIVTESPDIIGLVEALPSVDDLELLQKACPNYQFKRLYGTSMVGVKGTIDDVQFRAESNVYKFNYIEATVDGKQLRAIIADVNAIPFSNKKIPLGILHQFSKKHQVDILMGDFNTPYESVFFRNYKDHFNSFHRHSIGMTSTWPTPFPVIEIDQMWIAKSFHPIQLRKVRFPLSDHKMLIAEYQH